MYGPGSGQAIECEHLDHRRLVPIGSPGWHSSGAPRPLVDPTDTAGDRRVAPAGAASLVADGSGIDRVTNRRGSESPASRIPNPLAKRCSMNDRSESRAAPFAVALGDVHPAERLRLITVPTQGAESGRLGFRCVPEDSVHTGSLRTRITDDSQDGQSPATERVREQIDQSLDFIPSALRNGLHDTRLEPTDRTPDLLPFDGVPVGRTPGAAPAGISAADISACLPESVGRGSLVTEHPREVSPLSRRGDVVRGRTHPLSDRLPIGLGFLPHPFPAASSASLCSRPSLAGRQRGYFVHLLDHSGVRSCLSAGGASSATGELEPPYLATYRFGPSLTASLACLCLRPLSALHLG